MAKELLRFENVTKAYSVTPVINNLSFSVYKGEILGLLGPNGSGKTTTIRLTNGVIYPDTGRITLDGYDPVTQGDEVRQRCGVLTESAGLYEHLTALDNLLFFAELYEVDAPKQRAVELLTDFGLAAVAEKKVQTFSTGMKKRLGIAKALLHRPQVLFLDEPTTGLDPEGTRDLLNYIKKLNQKEHVTILIATHLLKQVQDLCHRFLFLHQGGLLEAGTFAELETKYLRSISLQVETDLEVGENEFAGYRIIGREPGVLRFQLNGKAEIPLLLKEILQSAAVYSVVIDGRNLETLYFKVREAKE